MVIWTQYVLDPEYLPWLWILVPLLILYMIRPRPIDQTIPSLMFLLQDKGKAISNSFLRYLYRDLVLLLQILILVLLVAAACRPYLSVSKTSLVGSSVVVIDASASMQTDDGRWGEAKRAAIDNLARQNTIILVKNRPVIVARDVTRDEAEEIIDGLKPSDTETNIYGAIIAAREFANGPDTVVTIVSDFRNTDDQQDYRAAAKTLIATGAVVRFIGVGTQVDNIGIISLDVDDQRTRIGVRNFGAASIVATVSMKGFEQAVPLAPGATDYVTIETPAGITEVKLEPNDKFALDNTAFIANADRFDVKMLVITNDAQVREKPWWLAMESISGQKPLDLTLEVSSPPQLPKIDHDIVVFQNVNPTLLVQRTIRDAIANVQNGGAVIIMGQPDLFATNYEELLPLTYESKGGASEIQGGQFSVLPPNLEFGDVQEYHKVKGNAGLVLATAGDGTPLISLYPVGKGRVLYYGINDAQSGFPLKPKYPVFWKYMVNQLTGRIAVEKLNVNTGGVPIGVAGTPTSMPGADSFDGFFDLQGAYVFADRTIAANLLSAGESDVSAIVPDESLTNIAADEANLEKEKELTGIFVLAALILLLLELFIVKYRGDF